MSNVARVGKPKYLPPAASEGAWRQREVSVLQIRSSMRDINNGPLINPATMQRGRAAGAHLRELLPRHSLKDFMTGHPAHFQIVELPGSPPWRFKILKGGPPWSHFFFPPGETNVCLSPGLQPRSLRAAAHRCSFGRRWRRFRLAAHAVPTATNRNGAVRAGPHGSTATLWVGPVYIGLRHCPEPCQ